jgi:hypothetical protein
MATIEDLMKLVDGATYIPKQAFIVRLTIPNSLLSKTNHAPKITTSLLVVLAILTAFLHVYLKLRQTASLHLDDFILLTSILCLIGTTAVIHVGLSDTYLANVISSNPSLIFLPPPPDVVNIAVNALRYTAASHCLTWTSIFAVKVLLLYFFKDCVDGLGSVNKKVKLYWGGILVLVVGGWAFILSVPFIACPHRGGEAGTWLPNPNQPLLRRHR